MNKIEILPFDLYCIIYINYVHDLLTFGYREQIRAAMYADNDFDRIEMCEIMLMPVIQIDVQKTSSIWIKFLVLEIVSSCFQDFYVVNV